MAGGVNNNKVRTSFDSMQEFIKKFDKSGDGSFDKDEIIAAQKYFNDADISKVTINGIDYNLLTDENKNRYDNINGSKGNDLILSTSADKVKGKGGDDIIIVVDAKKVKGGNGSDKIYADNVETVKGGSGNDSINSTQAETAKGTYTKIDDLVRQFDTDGNGALSADEIKAAAKYFKDAGINKVTIGGKIYNLLTDEDMNKRGKIKGTKDDDLILSTDAKKIKGKGGNDIIIAADTNKVKGGSGNDTVYYSGDNAKIKGGMGSDTLNVTGDKNKIKGQNGWDTFNVVGNQNRIDGGNSSDTFNIAGDGNVIDTGDKQPKTFLGQAIKMIGKLAMVPVSLAMNLGGIITGKVTPFDVIDWDYKGNTVNLYGNNNHIVAQGYDKVNVEGSNNFTKKDTELFGNKYHTDKDGNVEYTTTERYQTADLTTQEDHNKWDKFLEWAKSRYKN